MPTLLIIDDEPDMRELISLSIELGTSWAARTAATPAEAMAIAGDGACDGIVLDMIMPGKNGLELLADIRAIPAARSIPAVFLSGQSQPPAEDTLRELGVVGTIRKPFDPRTLAGELATLFGWTA